MSKISKEEYKELFKSFEQEYKKLKVVIAVLREEELSFNLRSFDKECTVPVKKIRVRENFLQLRGIIVPDEDFTTESIQIMQDDEVLWEGDFQYHIPKKRKFIFSYDYNIQKIDTWKESIK